MLYLICACLQWYHHRQCLAGTVISGPFRRHVVPSWPIFELSWHDAKQGSWLFLIQKLRFQYSYIHTTLTPKQYLKFPRQWGKHLSAGYCHTGPCHLRHLIFYSCGTQNTQDFPFQISLRIHGKYQLQRNIVRTISLLTSNTFQPLRGEVGKQDRFS